MFNIFGSSPPSASAECGFAPPRLNRFFGLFVEFFLIPYIFSSIFRFELPFVKLFEKGAARRLKGRRPENKGAKLGSEDLRCHGDAPSALCGYIAFSGTLRLVGAGGCGRARSAPAKLLLKFEKPGLVSIAESPLRFA
jgi:hypothetical protein